jgi:hypothetical protein
VSADRDDQPLSKPAGELESQELLELLDGKRRRYAFVEGCYFEERAPSTFDDDYAAHLRIRANRLLREYKELEHEAVRRGEEVAPPYRFFVSHERLVRCEVFPDEPDISGPPERWDPALREWIYLDAIRDFYGEVSIYGLPSTPAEFESVGQATAFEELGPERAYSLEA